MAGFIDLWSGMFFRCFRIADGMGNRRLRSPPDPVTDGDSRKLAAPALAPTLVPALAPAARKVLYLLPAWILIHMALLPVLYPPEIKYPPNFQ